MFFKLVFQNSKRSRKENALFFMSLIVSIIAFYIILSLSQQDVMIFLREMESDAVARLLTLIPVFYGATLVIMFFLIYFACNYQMECRRHELGLYLMLGMRRSKLFFLLLAEDLSNSILSLLIGLPIAVLISELISLITAKLVGLGIIGHHFSLSTKALLWTAVGFLLIKLIAFLILSRKISRQEIQTLLAGTLEGSKRQMPSFLYTLAFITGASCLGIAYYMAISGISWQHMPKMILTLALGFVGTLLLFYGLRSVMNLMSTDGKSKDRLHIFNFRQLQENVIHQSSKMAISSLLILSALCLFGAGIAIAQYYGKSETHVLDYTFEDSTNEGNERGLAYVQNTLKEHHLDASFSELFEMKVGHIRTTDNYNTAFTMESVMKSLAELPESDARDVLLNNLSYADYPYLIELSGYNKLLRQAGLPTLTLKGNEAAVYMDTEFVTTERADLLNRILSERPEAQIDGNPIYLTESIQSASLVTDRSITLSFALILPDDTFAYYTKDQYDIYVNGILDNELTNSVSLMSAISETNQKLDNTGLTYESYLQNLGRQLFYMVAASYITIYLAVIFLIVGNTIISVQFLMDQQKSNRRYKTLIRLGASYKTLCRSARKQINWHFGIPVAVAAVSSLFGVRALFSGILSSRTHINISELMLISGTMILLLFVIESIYMALVKHYSNRYLLTLMIPEREE